MWEEAVAPALDPGTREAANAPLHGRSSDAGRAGGARRSTDAGEGPHATGTGEPSSPQGTVSQELTSPGSVLPATPAAVAVAQTLTAFSPEVGSTVVPAALVISREQLQWACRKVFV